MGFTDHRCLPMSDERGAPIDQTKDNYLHLKARHPDNGEDVELRTMDRLTTLTCGDYDIHAELAINHKGLSATSGICATCFRIAKRTTPTSR